MFELIALLVVSLCLLYTQIKYMDANDRADRFEKALRSIANEDCIYNREGCYDWFPRFARKAINDFYDR
jgi:hypothetical protein